ncbi:MAG: KEOPS complex subunit Pcc1 [Candidatus Thorarchaeota archaeon]
MSVQHLHSANAQLVINLESAEIAQRVYLALEPETHSVASERAMTTIRVENSTLHIEIEASDLTALRASMNSFLAWVSACTKTAETLSKTKS